MGSQVIEKDRSRIPGKGTEKEDEEEEPATKRRREFTDLGEREEQVTCRASALDLAMTDEARRKAEM